MMERRAEIYDLLYKLGATANYAGFFHMAYAVYLCMIEPERLLLVTKWLYPDVAKQYKTSWRSVERNIRTLGCAIWVQNRVQLERIAHRPLLQKPCNTQLLAILVHELHARYAQPLEVQGMKEPDAFPAIQAANE